MVRFGGCSGQGVADERWCRIVNIPDDLSQNSIKYQSVISTNCARSTQRYDAFGSSFSSGNYPPVAPIAWDSNTASNAQLNSDEQHRRDAQGHFVVNSSWPECVCSLIELGCDSYLWLHQVRAKRWEGVIMLVLIVGLVTKVTAKRDEQSTYKDGHRLQNQ